MAWQPGQSGNPEGAKKPRAFYAALSRALAQDDGKRLRSAVEQLLNLAASGEGWAIKELRDTLDGKPAQTIAGDPDAPPAFVAVVERRIIDANPKT